MLWRRFHRGDFSALHCTERLWRPRRSVSHGGTETKGALETNAGIWGVTLSWIESRCPSMALGTSTHSKRITTYGPIAVFSAAAG